MYCYTAFSVTQAHLILLLSVYVASLPLNDSTAALSVGLPGREKSICIWRSHTHLSSIFPVNSVPLSVFRRCGNGRFNAIVHGISATSEERRFWPTQIPRRSRVKRSITVCRQSRRPSNNTPETKSMPHTWLGYSR